jgi:hypothetical protein
MYLIWETRTLVSKQPHDILKAEVTKHNHALNVPSPTRHLLRYMLQKLVNCHRPIIQPLSRYKHWLQRNATTDDLTLDLFAYYPSALPTVVICLSQRYNSGKTVCTNNFAFAHSKDKLILTRFNFNTELQFAYGSLPINLGLTRWLHLCH